MDIVGDLTLEEQDALCEPYFPTPPPDTNLLGLLQSVFKLDKFRPAQLDAIRYVISGRDCVVKMATGSGKSLLWQLPALVQTDNCNSLTVVICPTKCLIMDQMTKLCGLAPAMEAVCIHRDQPDDLNNIALALLEMPHLLPHVLLITPELLSSNDGKHGIHEKLRTIHEAGRLARFVIDEADKFLGWGGSFRDPYLRLENLRAWFRNVPILAMSGSITKDVLEASVNRLGMQNYALVSESLNRPNIFYEVKPKQHRLNTIRDIMGLLKEGPGIVYCTYIVETVEIAETLRQWGVSAESYCAKLSKEKHKKVLDSWRTGSVDVIVATQAFGMGIDKSDVRWVVHETMPSSIEGWFQESGRAGRDGLAARCIIYFRPEDSYKVKKLITEGAPVNKVTYLLKPLHQLTEILLNPVLCRRRQLLAHFDEIFPQENCRHCDNCVHGWETGWSLQDATIDALNALELLSEMCKIKPYWTEHALAAAIRGERRYSAFTSNRVQAVTMLKGFGCQFAQACGKDATKSEIIKFLLVLIHKNIITEYKYQSSSMGPNSNTYAQRHIYIMPGPRAKEIMDRILKVEIYVKLPVIREVDPLSGRMVDVIIINDD